MNKDLRKRLEEAAEKYQEEYETTERVAFTHGAVWGYKEAIALVKEWIQKNVPIIHTEEGDYVRVNMGHKNVPMNKYLADFETDMNKLWEE